MTATTQLTKENLCEMLPYLKEELDYVSRREVGKYYAHGVDKHSNLESAVLIVGQNTGLPNPTREIRVEDSTTDISETQIEFVNAKGEVDQRLSPPKSYTSYADSIGLSPTYHPGAITDRVFSSMAVKPLFVVVKKIETAKVHGANPSEVSNYNIEVYKMG